MWQSKNIFSYPATIFKEKSAKIAFLTQKYAQFLQNDWILATYSTDRPWPMPRSRITDQARVRYHSVVQTRVYTYALYPAP